MLLKKDKANEYTSRDVLRCAAHEPILPSMMINKSMNVCALLLPDTPQLMNAAKAARLGDLIRPKRLETRIMRTVSMMRAVYKQLAGEQLSCCVAPLPARRSCDAMPPRAQPAFVARRTAGRSDARLLRGVNGGFLGAGCFSNAAKRAESALLCPLLGHEERPQRVSFALQQRSRCGVLRRHACSRRTCEHHT